MGSNVSIKAIDRDHHTRPSLTPELRSLVDLGAEPSYRNGRMCMVIRNRWQPPSDPTPLVTSLNTALAAYARYMAPAPADRISARITVLLSHFYVPDVPEPLQRAILTDWLDALAPYPAWAIDKACRTWLHREARKPTIADIRKLAEEAVQPARSEHWALKAALGQCTGTLAEFTDWRPRSERTHVWTA